MTQRGRGRPPHPGILTPAERRVLEELRRGGTNAEIAVRLGVTLDAVKFHISNMLGKLQLENREQLAAWRPEPRRRLFGLLALPGALEPVGRVLVWAGVAVAGAAAVAVVAVVLIVLAGVDGSEQQLAFAPSATATPPATATATATPEPEDGPTLRYNLLDTTGAATAAGSYAFLTTAGDATSAIENFGFLPGRGVELRTHPADASGASRAAFYGTVQVGDTFDYRTNGLDCGFRFKVTSLGATATPRTFEIERIRRYGTRCGDFVDDPGAARDVQFVWKVRTGLPGPGGVRVLLRDEPTGEGTYRISEGLPWVFDVPSGTEIVFVAIYMNAYEVGSNLPRRGVLFRDTATGSTLHIDPETGRDFYRVTTSSAVDALFDQIVDSIRRVEVE